MTKRMKQHATLALFIAVAAAFALGGCVNAPKAKTVYMSNWKSQSGDVTGADSAGHDLDQQTDATTDASLRGANPDEQDQ